MKTRNIFALAALGLLGLSGCSSEEELTEKQDRPQAIQFEVSIENKSMARTNPGDDAKSTQFNQNDQVSITSFSKTCNYKYDGKNWVPAPAEGQSPFLWEVSTSYFFYAQYPLADTANGFTVPTDQSDATKLAAADYMRNKWRNGVQYSKEPVVIMMQREMARVNITGFTFTGELANKNAQVTAVAFYSLDQINGSSTPQYVEISPLEVNQGYMALLAPTEQNSNQNFVKVTVSYGDNGSEVKDFFVKNTPALAAGYKYEYTMKVGVEKVEMNSVSVKPWTDAPETNIEMNTDSQPIVDAEAHKVTVINSGTLKQCYLNEAFGSANNDLTVEGTADVTDLQAIADFCKQEGKTINLILSNLEGFTTLPANSFKDSKALAQITLPTSVTELGEYALANTGLTEFTIPETVTTIGQGILSGCTNLATINLLFEKKAEVTYNYHDLAFEGVGTSQDVTLNLHTTWQDGVAEGTEFTYKGGTFTRPAKVYAVKFNDAGILAGNTTPNPVSSVTYEALVNFNSFENTDKVNTIIGKEGVLLLRVGDAGIPNNITQLCLDNEENLTVGPMYGFETNTWYHLAMTYDSGSGKSAIYINGKEVATQQNKLNLTFDIWSSGSNGIKGLCIGRYNGFRWGNRPFNGMMKEVRVWSVARSQQDIQANMMSVDPKTTGLEVYYKLDGNDITGNTVTNSATGKANGTVFTGNGGSLTKFELQGPIEIQ